MDLYEIIHPHIKLFPNPSLNNFRNYYQSLIYTQYSWVFKHGRGSGCYLNYNEPKANER